MHAEHRLSPFFLQHRSRGIQITNILEVCLSFASCGGYVPCVGQSSSLNVSLPALALWAIWPCWPSSSDRSAGKLVARAQKHCLVSVWDCCISSVLCSTSVTVSERRDAPDWDALKTDRTGLLVQARMRPVRNSWQKAEIHTISLRARQLQDYAGDCHWPLALSSWFRAGSNSFRNARASTSWP